MSGDDVWPSYEQVECDSAVVRCVWRMEATSTGKWTDAATEFWGVAFSTAGDGSARAYLAGPSLAPREFEYTPDGRTWGVDLRAHVFWRGLDKVSALGELRALQVEAGFFELAGVRHQVPSYDGLLQFVNDLLRLGTLTTDPAVAQALAGQDPHLAERTLRRRTRASTGLNPTSLAQLRRAQSAYRFLQEGRTLTEAAADAGYADQSHMTRALGAFTGRSPLRILTASDLSM